MFKNIVYNEEKIIKKIIAADGIKVVDGWIIPGDLNLSFMEMTTLPNIKIVCGSLNISYNCLITLIGGPQIVGKDYFCHGNQLVSLTGCANYVGGNFYAAENNLIAENSLENRPKFVGGYFDCSYQRRSK